MLRSIAVSLILSAALCAGQPVETGIHLGPGQIRFPDHLGGFKKAGEGVVSNHIVGPDKALWEEFGLQAKETAIYQSLRPTHQAAVAAWRFKDPSGAYGAFLWKRPADARASKLAPVAAGTKDGVILVYGNYLIEFGGWKPASLDELNPVLQHLPALSKAALPPVADYLPSANRVPNSERYFVGPEGLKQFDPAVPPAVAAFDFGTEVAVATYRTPAGNLPLALFWYPNAQIAIQRLPDFQKLPGAQAQRVGPMIALVLPAPNATAAQNLISSVKYEASITMNERVPTADDNIPALILGIFALIGFLLIFFLVFGLIFGFLRRWLGWGTAADAMIVLHLEDHQTPQ